MSAAYVPVPGVVYVGNLAPRRRRGSILLSTALSLTALAFSAGSLDPARVHAPTRSAPIASAPVAPRILARVEAPQAAPVAKLDPATTELIFGTPLQATAFSLDPGRRTIALAGHFETPEPAVAPMPPVRIASLPVRPVEQAEVETSAILPPPPLPPANPFRPQHAVKTVVASVTPQPLAPRATQIRTAAAAPAAPEQKGFFEKLFGGPDHSAAPALAYARTDEGLTSRPALLPHPAVTEKTAIYDIGGRVVILPNGRRLEAHSGLGQHLDDPRSMNLKMRGVTPTGTYNLRLREALFHGVRALRLLPTDETRMYGRDGILAHTFMLGPRGDSNGCVSFRDYDEFLAAFQRGEVTRLVVVANSSALPMQTAAR